MVVTWVTLLKTVPWTEVIANAPAITDGAKKLWNTVARKSPESPSGKPAAPVSASAGPAGMPAESAALAELRAELQTMKATVDDLHGQMLASSELIKALADQNAELIKRTETHRRWMQRLLIGLVAVALALAGAVTQRLL